MDQTLTTDTWTSADSQTYINTTLQTEWVPESILLLRNVLFVICSVVGTTGNLLVICAALTNNQLNTASNKYIVNLAVADLLVCAILMPYSVATDARQGAPPGCVVMAGLSATVMCVSMNNLAVIAFNRYVLIVKSTEKYAMMFNRRNLVISLWAIWCFSIVVCLPPYIGLGEYGYNGRMGVCLMKWDLQGYIYIQSVLHTFSAFPTMAWTLYCYVSIFKAFKKVGSKLLHADTQRHLAIVAFNNMSSAAIGSSSVGSSTNAATSTGHMVEQNIEQKPNESSTRPLYDKRSERHHKDKYRIVFNMFIIWCTFVSCWTPLIFVYTVDYNMEVSASFYHLAGALAYMNSAINPAIYAGLNRKFRAAFAKMLFCNKYGGNHDSGT